MTETLPSAAFDPDHPAHRPQAPHQARHHRELHPRDLRPSRRREVGHERRPGEAPRRRARGPSAGRSTRAGRRGATAAAMPARDAGRPRRRSRARAGPASSSQATFIHDGPAPRAPQVEARPERRLVHRHRRDAERRAVARADRAGAPRPGAGGRPRAARRASSGDSADHVDTRTGRSARPARSKKSPVAGIQAALEQRRLDARRRGARTPSSPASRAIARRLSA